MVCRGIRAKAHRAGGLAGVENDDVDATVFRQQLVPGPLTPACVRSVAGEEVETRAVRRHLAHPWLPTTVRVTRGCVNMAAAKSQGCGDFGAKAAARAEHECDLVLEIREVGDVL